ncbi:T9SS type A sorting domain-containing protein [Pontimicrobium aquaticum]|uniref:T9SS type A sorting domain-containing protein n=1 Tax=Pontimicrobium aquaticum TaxID=2565367 RepID=A0A4U0EY07_9FLAO|nr:T9SS type A sorting domain-containing protein [Pontimicrobium aquaticum]TJY36284.1 T9SS type A sorting domain-containing protein [Pontimicrobium aquaticum]
MKREVLFIVLVVFSWATIYGQTEVQNPPPPGYWPFYFCDDDYDEITTFDLTMVESYIVGDEYINDFDFYYFNKESGISSLIPIEDPINYTNSTNPDETVMIRRIEISTGYTYDIYPEIFVLPPLIINKPSPLAMCNINNNGFNTFKLQLKNDEILSGLDQSLVSITYHESVEDAENNINSLDENSYTNSVAFQQKIFPRLTYNIFDNRYLIYPGCYSITELDLIVSQDSQDYCEDIEILLYSDTSPRPGFNYVNHLIVKNTGTEAVTSGTVEFAYDSLLTFNSVSNVDSNDNVTPTSNGFTLNFNNLNVGEEKEIDISMYVPTSVSLDTKLTNSAVYTGADFNQDNNTFDLSEIVIGSFDPNDIMESHGPKIQFNEFTESDYLYYTIRFQNVGTADAINVRIENELDSELDESTFQLLASSHTNNLNRLGKKLTWTFNNIHLPSEDMNEPESHGFVYYKIKPKAGFTVGDIIPNTAAIYFDFNEPVITNTFQTEFEERLSVGKNSFLDSNLYPNPASDYINIEFKNNSEKNIEIFDVQGKLIMKKETQLKEIQINISNLVEGLYFVKIKDDLDGGAVIKKIIIK